MTHKYVLAAIKKKDVNRFMQLIEYPGYDVNMSVKGVTPLILAAKLNLPVVSEKLIHMGADLNVKDKDGKTALLHACLHGNSNIVHQLLMAGCDTSQSTVSGDFALHESVSSGDINTVQTLLDGGADINQTNCISGYTPLMLALLSVQGHIVRLLLRHGARPNQSVPEGDTALHFAVQVAPLDVVIDLINAGCKMNKLNNMGETPLIVSIYEGRLDVARVLILSGCKIYKYDYFSPLCVACIQNSPVMVKYLLSEGYNVSKDNSVKQNLFLKFEDHNPDLFQYMLEERCTQPISLKETARVRIRRLIGPNVSNLVYTLGLPARLNEWIAKDIIY